MLLQKVVVQILCFMYSHINEVYVVGKTLADDLLVVSCGEESSEIFKASKPKKPKHPAVVQRESRQPSLKPLSSLFVV